MALHGTLTHWKTQQLAGIFGIALPYALGLVQTLLDITAQEAPAGDIGILSNNAIAAQMFAAATGIEPDALIAGFVQSGWLREDAVHRLIVSEWSIKHADNHVHAKLARRCLRFADGTIPNSRQLNNYEREEFYKWLEGEGEPKPRTGRPSTPKMQGKCRVNAGEMQVPVPVPVPVPKEVSDANASSPRRDADGGQNRIPPEREIYKAYPKKVKPRKAIEAIKNALVRIRKGKDGDAIPDLREAEDYLLRRVKAYAASAEGTREDRVMIPHPTTWFNASRYLEDDAEWQQTQPAQGAPNGRSRAQSKQDRTIDAVNEYLRDIPGMDRG